MSKTNVLFTEGWQETNNWCLRQMFCLQKSDKTQMLFVSCHSSVNKTFALDISYLCLATLLKFCKQNICLRHQLFVSCHSSVNKTFALELQKGDKTQITDV
jgi:hypothetical protein